MAEYDIHPGNRRHRTLGYTKADGSAGVVQDPPSWDINDAQLAQLDIDPDNMHGIISHNGAVGDFVINSVADGDIGLGEHRIVIADTFHMLAPLGATGGGSTVGDEEPIPPPGP